MSRKNKISTRASVPCDTTRADLAMRADTLNTDKRSIVARISTETPAQVMDWNTWRIIDEVLLGRGCQAPDKVPFLDAHQRSTSMSVIGSAREITPSDKGVDATIYFMKGDANVDPIWARVEQGHLDSVSVGYRALDYVDIPAGGSQEVNGKTYKANADCPLRITKKWALKEVSAVPIGADEFAKMRSEANLNTPRQTRKESPMKKLTPAQKAYLATLGLRAEATDADVLEFYAKLEDAQRTFCDSLNVEPEAKREEPKEQIAPLIVASEDQIRAAEARGFAAEQNRQVEIKALAKPGDAKCDQIVARAIKDRLTVEQARDIMLVHYRDSKEPPVKTAPGMIVRMGESDLTPRLLGAALLHRAGCPQAIVPLKEYPKSGRFIPEALRKEADELQGRSYEFNYLSMMDVARMAIEMDGDKAPRNPIEIVKRALSGATLGSIFTQSIDAVMVQRYELAPDSTAPLCRVRDVANFKTQTEFGMQSTGPMELLPRGGNISDSTFDDNEETFRVHRYAKHFTIDEQDIIDDHFNALSDVPAELAENAAQTWPDLFYAFLAANATMADGHALFDNTYHTNALDTAYSGDQLSAAKIAMMKQQINGKNLNISPAYIVAAVELWRAINIDLQSPTIEYAGAGGGSNAFSAQGSANVLQNLVRPIIDSRISNGVTDPYSKTAHAGSATAYYFFADPACCRGIVKAFIAGTGRAPSLVSFVKNGQGGKFGIEFTIKLDQGIGIGPGGWRGILRGNV